MQIVQNIYQAKRIIAEILQEYPLFLESLGVAKRVNVEDIDIEDEALVIKDATKLDGVK